MASKSRAAAAALSMEAFGEALTTALTNEQVIEALYKALMPSLEKAIQIAVDAAVAGIQVKLDEKESLRIYDRRLRTWRPTVVWTMSSFTG